MRGGAASPLSEARTRSPHAGPTRELVRTLNQRARTTASQVSLRGRQVELADANRASVSDVVITGSNDRRMHGHTPPQCSSTSMPALRGPSPTTSMLDADAPPQRGCTAYPRQPRRSSRFALERQNLHLCLALRLDRQFPGSCRLVDCRTTSPVTGPITASRPLLSRLQMIKRGRPWTVR